MTCAELNELKDRVMSKGPDLVVIDSQGTVAKLSVAQKIFGIRPDVIFIWSDGESIGAPRHLEQDFCDQCHDKWIARIECPWTGVKKL